MSHEGHITAGVRRWVSQYTVTAVPEGHRWANDHHFQITLDRCTDDPHLWSVSRYGGGEQLDPTGRRWNHAGGGLWPLNVALLYAEQVAPDVEVNGMRAGDLK